MSRIMFVDDEPSILSGLRNALRRKRDHWHMVFVNSGAEALAEIEREPVDLVVSDMRMPGMDGADLLTRIKRDHPVTARIVLSGHADREAVLRALPVAQQYLTKPCDVDVLCHTIERTVNLQGLMHQGAVRRVIGALDHLPSVPATYLALQRAMTLNDIDMREVASIIEGDTAMTVKVLQLVNSAYFGLGRAVTSIRHAVTLLGLELLKGFVLGAQVFSAIENEQLKHLDGFCLDELQKDSVLVARIAQRCVGAGKEGELALTAGLVHDVGQIVLALAFRERYAAVCGAVHAQGLLYHRGEQELLGVSHAEVGAYLLGVWGLPTSVVELAAYHHEPSRFNAPPADCRPLAALHVADMLSCSHCRPLDNPDTALDHAFLARAGVEAELPRWRDIAAEEMEGRCV